MSQMESVRTLFKVSHMVSRKSYLIIIYPQFKCLPIMLILAATLITSITPAFRKSKSFLQSLGSPRWSIHTISCAKDK